MRRKPRQITTGRLQSLRLFSTLLAIHSSIGFKAFLDSRIMPSWVGARLRFERRPNVYEIEMVARSERT